VSIDVERMLDSKTAHGDIVVSGYVYDIHTGLATQVTGPRSRNAPTWPGSNGDR
jgi:hypothetical protein